MAGGKEAASLKDLLLITAVSVVFLPMLFVAIAAALAIPVAAMAVAFRDSYGDTEWELRSGRIHVWRDLLLRVALLALVVLLFAWAVGAGISSELPYLLLLSWGGGILGDLVAMIVWLSRRHTVAATSIALLKK